MAEDGQVRLGARRPGRGAWLHPAEDCLTAAIRRRAFGRALRAELLDEDPRAMLDRLGSAVTDPGASG